MNRRLQQFLEVEKLSPARLADSLGIQRSGISHLLSGRNKPSYEFINNFLTRYPQIDATWLITGKGKMYKDDFTPYSPDEIDFRPQKVDETQDISLETEDNRKAKRITVYYSDGSFQDFYPSK
jgi:transcriptional regulator with XRE-family HTH domain